MYIPDNYAAWKQYQDERNRQLAGRQVCSECDEPITDEYCYYINGEYICSDCMEQYKVETPVEDY